jgi:hypothetical protein
MQYVYTKQKVFYFSKKIAELQTENDKLKKIAEF